ncbi:hypothetical protein Dsin_023326 [Dipteronia sinensis]|uniref:HMA domain-containing protein n=1 Tax=Dipteronia sinensis TaxID=43782 RepID=A0AAE0A4Q2_9ROSI|nr:hypothetical protein Dsin_023326 [Dipteronia sinensis]
MKQKIVIKAQVRCKKCWSTVMKIVALAEGEIFSVAWEGEKKDKVVVIGDGVDAATLTTNLRKKLGCAELLLVQEVKEKKEEPQKPEKVTEPTPPSYPFLYPMYGSVVVYEDPCTSTCNIM